MLAIRWGELILKFIYPYSRMRRLQVSLYELQGQFLGCFVCSSFVYYFNDLKCTQLGGLAIWYIRAGQGHGNPYSLVITTVGSCLDCKLMWATSSGGLQLDQCTSSCSFKPWYQCYTGMEKSISFSFKSKSFLKIHGLFYFIVLKQANPSWFYLTS